jgi:hypothetical protein
VRIPGTRRARAIAFATAVGLVAGCGLLAYRRFVAFYERLGPLLVSELRASLGRNISVRHVDYRTPGILRLRGVRVPERGNPLAPPVAEAAEMVVRYRWDALLTGARSIAAALEVVEVKGLRLHLSRSANGEWNIGDLLRAGQRGRRGQFRGQVRIHLAAVDFRDDYHRDSGEPLSFGLRGMDAEIDARDYPRVTFSGRGAIAGPRAGSVSSQGYFRAGTPEWLARLTFHQVDAAHWSRQLGLYGTLAVASGTADANLVLTAPPQGQGVRPVAEGEVRLTQAVLNVPGLARPLEGATLAISGAPNMLVYRGSGLLAGAPVQFEGTSLPGPGGRYHLTFQAAPMGLRPVLEVFPAFAAPAGLEAGDRILIEGEVAGGPGPVIVSGRLRTDRATVQRVPVSDLSAQWRSVGKITQVSDLRARLLGGEIRGEGWISGEGPEPEVYLVGRATGVRLAQLPGIEKPIAGTAGGEFIAQGPVGALQGSGDLEVSNLSAGSFHLDQAQAHWSYDDRRVTITDSRLLDERGHAVLLGSAGLDGTLDLQFDLTVPSLQKLSSDLHAPGLSGEARCQGRIGGSLEEPRVAARFRLDHPAWKERQLDWVEGWLSWQGPRVILTGVRAVQMPAVAEADRVVLERTPEGGLVTEGDASIRNINLAQLIRIAGGDAWLEREPIAGRVTSLSARFAGPVEAIQASVQARAEAVALRAFAVGRLEAEGELDLGRREARLKSVLAVHGNQRIEASGSIALTATPAEPSPGSSRVDSPVSLSLAAANIPVIPLIRRFAPAVFDYAELEGEVSRLRLTVGGTFARPRLGGEIMTSPVRLNGEALKPATGRFAWRPELLVLSDVLIESKSGARLAVPAAAWVPGSGGAEKGEDMLRQVAGTLRVADLPLSQAKRLLANGPYSQTDRGRRLVEWSAQYLRPTTECLIQVVATAPSPVPVEEAWSDDTVVRVAAARARHPSVRTEVSIPDLTILTLPAEEEESGDPSVRPLHLKIDARLAYEPDRVDLDDLVVDQIAGDALLKAHGWREIASGPAADRNRMQLEADAVNIPLTAVSRLPLGKLQEYLKPLMPLKGMAEVHAVATGAAAAPNVQLSASIDHPVVRGVPFDELNADQVELAADESQLRLIDCDLVKRHAGHDHRVRISGDLPFSWSIPGIIPDRPRNLTVTAADQPLEVVNELLAAVGSRDAGSRSPLLNLGVTDGSISAQVHLRGTANAPENTGQILLHGGRLRLGVGDTALQNVEADLQFAGNEVHVKRFTGASNRTGGFQVTGRARLGRDGINSPSTDLDLALEVSQFRFIEEHLERFNPALRGTAVRGTVQTVSRESGRDPEAIRITGPWNHPRIAGAVRLTHATTGIPGSFGPAAGSHPVIDPELDLRLYVGEDVSIRNPLVDMRLGGSIWVSNTLSAPVVTGRLTVPRGSLQMPAMRFRVEGAIRVAYDPRQPQAAGSPTSPLYLELTGVTHVPMRTAGSQTSEDVEVVMTVRGAPTGSTLREDRPGLLPTSLPGKLLIGGEADGLSVEFRSDPPLPAGELASLMRQQLGVEGLLTPESNLQTVLRNQVQLALANTVAPLLTSRIEDYLQQALGLDILTIEVGGVEQPLQLRVGKRLLGGLYGSFSQQVGSATSESRRNWELYYRLSPGLRLGVRQEQPSDRQLFFLSGSVRFR